MNVRAGCVLWFTGLSGAGKTTIAQELASILNQQKHICCVLDGDVLRRRLNSDLGFSESDRMENLRRIAEVANLFCEAGLITIVATISPFTASREAARKIVGSEHFFEIFIDTPLQVCEQRDPKGFYKKVRAGKLTSFTGIDSPYEPPQKPDLKISTTSCDAVSCANEIIDSLLRQKYSDL